MNPLVAFVVSAGACLALSRCVVLGAAGIGDRRARSRAWLLASAHGTARSGPGAIGRLRRALGDRHDDLWAAWLDAAVRSARSGASLRDALVDAADSFRASGVGDHLHAFSLDLARGTPLESALASLQSSHGSTESATLATRALQLAARAGGASAVVLEAVAATLHERAALRREVRALSTQARASAAVMVAAPLVFALLAGGADRRVLAFLATGPGLICVLAGLALDGVGALWMARIVRGAG